MGKNDAQICGPKHPIPTKALRALLDLAVVPRHPSGIPHLGSEEFARVHGIVTSWLYDFEGVLGTSELMDSELENDTTGLHAAWGACPTCDQSDGFVVIGGEDAWVVCHRHFIRWRISIDVVRDHLERGIRFPVWCTDDTGILRYTEIPFHRPACMRPTILERVHKFFRRSRWLLIDLATAVYDYPVVIAVTLFPRLKRTGRKRPGLEELPE